MPNDEKKTKEKDDLDIFFCEKKTELSPINIYVRKKPEETKRKNNKNYGCSLV